MKLRNILLIVLAVPLCLGAGLFGIYKYRKFQQRERDREITRTQTTGTITFRCSDRWAAVDYDPKTVGPPVLNIIAHHGTSHLHRIEWSVQRPGSQPIPASTFDINTHSIGGSRGLSWRESDGREMTATLSFSDIVGRYGPETIWLRVSSGQEPSHNPVFEPGPGALICGPDPASYRST